MQKGLAFSLVLLFLGIVLPARAQDPAGVWADVDASSITTPPQFVPLPVAFRALRLDAQALLDVLAQAPLQRTPEAATANVVLSLPLPDGSFSRFRIVESPVMAPALGAKFPQIKTYAGWGLDDATATVRFDWTPHGFHALIHMARGTVFVDPYSKGLRVHYLSYRRQDARRSRDQLPDGPDVVLDEQGMRAKIEALMTDGVTPSGAELRTYRTAVAATGEYTIFHGGTVPDGLAAIVTAVNRVNEVYVRDVAVFLELIANNDLIIYTNPATDPYTNSNGVIMLGENQANLDAVIGSANYDIGHVFSTGGGGVANLGVVCVNGLKARGVTGLANPIGDPFYIDYVAHEMGHQYNATHTFNGTAGSCSGNRTASTAYEPGSGTTIMAYAGICGSQDIQPNSDDHFHTASFDQIVAFTTAGAGNGCPVITNTGNDPPVPDAGLGGFTIPLSTPFSLLGAATDPNGDPMTFNWEQFDLGPAGHPNNPVGNAPLFRSFPSQIIPERTFPQLSDIVNNTQTIGEILPDYAREITFRLTVRDNQPGGGGVDTDMIAFNVTDLAGPFLVTGPNTLVTWTIGAQETVSWDVAGTDGPPVNAATVNVLLSTDGGFTYPHTLAANTANDGAETITVPNTPTTQARVKVEAAANVFFDISNADFTIETGGGASFTITLKRVFVKPTGKQKAVVKWNPAEVTGAKIDFYVAEDPTQPAPDGSPDTRTANDGKHKLTVPPGGGGPLYNIQACEKKSTTVCSNVLQADFTDAVVSDEPDDDEAAGRAGEAPASVEAQAGVPAAFALKGNYPNPFNPQTQIVFDLPARAEVSVVVVDVLGRQVMALPAQTMEAGSNRTVTVDGAALSSGTYFYRLVVRMPEAAMQVATGRMVLVK